MWSNDWLILIWIIEALGVLEVRDIDGGNVVSEGDCEVGEFSVVGDVGVDGECVLGLLGEVDEEFSNTLLAGGVFAGWVDDPDLTGSDGGSESGGFRVSWDELDVLDTTSCFKLANDNRR